MSDYFRADVMCEVKHLSAEVHRLQQWVYNLGMQNLSHEPAHEMRAAMQYRRAQEELQAARDQLQAAIAREDQARLQLRWIDLAGSIH